MNTLDLNHSVGIEIQSSKYFLFRCLIYCIITYNADTGLSGVADLLGFYIITEPGKREVMYVH